MDLDKLTSADFRPYLGQPVAIHYGGEAPLAAELAQVTDLGPVPERPGAPARAPFAIILRGPYRPVLPQRIYRVEHQALGALEIFFVPVGPDQQGMCYEAIFN
jgi:hypothetical protein